MAATDSLGLPLSGASARAADLYRTALDGYHRFGGEPILRLREAVADSPGFAMAHVLTAYMTLTGSDPRVRAMGLRALNALQGLETNSREAGHVAAVRALADGELSRAGRILEDVSIADAARSYRPRPPGLGRKHAELSRHPGHARLRPGGDRPLCPRRSRWA